LINRPLATALPRLQLPRIAPAMTNEARLVGLATRFEPNLRVRSHEVTTAEAQMTVTRKARLPDVVAGIEGRQYSGDGDFREGMFTVGLSLPWLNRGRYRSELARDRARLEAAQFERADEELRVREDTHRLLVEIDAARREAVLYRDEIEPRSRQALEAAHANWAAGRGQFMETMEARRLLLEAELMQARAVARQYEALSELVLCCGLGDFESLQILPEDATP
jgi:outer membrane protein TolC